MNRERAKEKHREDLRKNREDFKTLKKKLKAVDERLENRRVEHRAQSEIKQREFVERYN